MMISLLSVGIPTTNNETDYRAWPVEYDIDGQKVASVFHFGGIREYFDTIAKSDDMLRSAIAKHLVGLARDKSMADRGDLSAVDLTAIEASYDAVMPKLVEAVYGSHEAVGVI